MPSFVECRNVTKTYHVGEVTIPAANGIDFSIEKGEFVVIVGTQRSRQDNRPQYSRRHGPSHLR